MLCWQVALEQIWLKYAIKLSFLTLIIKFRPLNDLSLGKIHMTVGTEGARGGQEDKGAQGAPKVFSSD